MNDAETHDSRSERETERIAAELAKELRGGDIVALHGELGAGKTRFVRGLAKGLGIDPRAVSSPTFVLMQEYQSAREETPLLVHIDAYRLSVSDELEALDAPLGEPGAICVIEWAERIESALPTTLITVWLEVADTQARRIRIERRRHLKGAHDA